MSIFFLPMIVNSPTGGCVTIPHIPYIPPIFPLKTLKLQDSS
jgi:hypothetical protein